MSKKLNTDFVLNTIMQCVVDDTGLNEQSIIAKVSLKKNVRARQLFSYLGKELIINKFPVNLSLKMIGDKINRDHSTVIYSHKTVKNDIKFDTKYRQRVNVLMYDLLFRLDANRIEKISKIAEQYIIGYYTVKAITLGVKQLSTYVNNTIFTVSEECVKYTNDIQPLFNELYDIIESFIIKHQHWVLPSYCEMLIINDDDSDIFTNFAKDILTILKKTL